MAECGHENLKSMPDAEGDCIEARLTRRFTTYYCPDCDYEAETPPDNWEDCSYEPEYDFGDDFNPNEEP